METFATLGNCSSATKRVGLILDSLNFVRFLIADCSLRLRTRVWVWAGLIHISIRLFRADGQIICGWFYPWIQMILRMEFLLCRLGDGLLLGYGLITNLNIDINTATEILLFSVLFGKILQIFNHIRIRILSLIKLICNWIDGDA